MKINSQHLSLSTLAQTQSVLNTPHQTWLQEKGEYLTMLHSSVLYEVQILVDLEIVMSQRSHWGCIIILRITEEWGL